ncbi:uncharacterized protein UMAG_05300 [Mycosarcoma maydis]|uniref:Uncharacterized protein n=2 Tax=Mycosarcoma maydis TaxID=5270 RepID=A0A0D1DUN4_MYCMD|nr:uncharacterized protein UMAG_05300 [Ustilago maydis 521]KIS66300.1 hypothetical protein UMAG_05300 [Ustilago maydis 521]|eukprot:XP_011392013.1 hypothetical protein UMAG_05300 [Ustilago maydis 521]
MHATFLFFLFALVTLHLHAWALPSQKPALSDKESPHLEKRDPTQRYNLRTVSLNQDSFRELVRLLGYQVSFLGYSASKVEPHLQNTDSIQSMMGLIHRQMSSFPNRRQFIPLTSKDRNIRTYAMPLFLDEFKRHREVLGNFAGAGYGDNVGSQRALIFGVRRPNLLDLTLYRGPTGGEPAIVELYGIASFKNARTFHSRVELPWQDRYIAQSLHEILR